MDLGTSKPAEIRTSCRSGDFQEPTFGLAPGYVQANLVILPKAFAEDFEGFCTANPLPCPLLEVTQPGSYELKRLAADADLRTDLPRYRVFRRGEIVEEPTDILHLFRDDLVSFLLGCSFSFEEAMLRSGLGVRHIEENKNVPMYCTNTTCHAVGAFRGRMVVSMRPLEPALVQKASDITSKYSFAHGGPVHVGDPASIGIADLDRPDFGDAVTVHPTETPVFWACGVTPQLAIMESRVDFAITHSPGCMFVSDIRSEDYIQGELV